MSASPAIPIGATLDDGWRLFLRSLTVIFLPVWIAGIVDVLPDAYAGGGLLTGSLSGSTLALMVLAWLVESALYGSAIAKLDAFTDSRAYSYIAALRRGISAAPTILVSNLLYNLASWCGLLLFILPGIILGTTLAFFAFAAVLDRKNILEALGYSHTLTWPDWWRTSIVISVPAIVLFIFDVVASWPDIMSAVRQASTGELSSAPPALHPWFDFGLIPFMGACVWCYVLAVCYIQYCKLKARAAVH